MSDQPASLKVSKNSFKDTTLEAESDLINHMDIEKDKNKAAIKVCAPNGKYNLSYKVGHLPNSLSVDILGSS